MFSWEKNIFFYSIYSTIVQIICVRLYKADFIMSFVTQMNDVALVSYV